MLKFKTKQTLFVIWIIPLMFGGAVPALPDIQHCSFLHESPENPEEQITATYVNNRFNKLQELYFTDSDEKACQGRLEHWPAYLNPVSCPDHAGLCTREHYRLFKTNFVQLYSFEKVQIIYSKEDSIQFSFTNAMVVGKESALPKQIIRKITLTQDRKKGIVTTSFWNDDECKEVCRPLNSKISTVIQVLDTAGHLLNEQYRDSTGGIISVQDNQ